MVIQRQAQPTVLVILLCTLALIFGCEEGNEESRTAAPSGEAPSPQSSSPVDPLEHGDLGPLGHHLTHHYPASLETVIEKRFLRVLTSRNAFDFFIHRGQRGGYQYEMVEAFTNFLNQRHLADRSALPIRFELIPVDDDQMIPLLSAGSADLIAARLTITPDRAKQLRFSKPYRTVDELVVTHEGTDPIDSVEDLSGKTVAVRQSSSYHESLLRLNRTLEEAGRTPVEIAIVDEALETERILQLVAARRYPYAVADSLVAQLAIRIYPQLRILDDIALRRGGQLAWATQPAAKALAEEMNLFLSRYKEKSLLGNLAVRKYFASDSELTARLADDGTKTLSRFDPLFKKHAAVFGLDWRLAAAMAHQESRFDPAARSPWGAIGLFQIKLSTAREPYIDIPDIEGPEHVSHNVEAGLKYLAWIKKRYFDSDPEMQERDRLRMALAAYNAGPRVVQRARRRATGLGLDPNRWFRNVELALLDLGKTEPVKYVSEINQRYLAYVLLGVE